MTSTSDSGIVPPPPAIKYAPSAVDAIVEAYYPRQVAQVDGARSRAQSAYAIASTLASVLVGAGLLTTLKDQADVVKAAGVVALVCWLCAAGLYLRAVASPIDLVKPGAQKGPTAFVNAVLAHSIAERKAIDRRLKVANGASLVALIATTATVALSLFVSPETVDGTVVLSSGGISAVAEVCPTAPETIEGAMSVDSIGSETLHIRADEGQCDESSVDLDLARSAISAIRTDD